jgi:hypothetical protein
VRLVRAILMPRRGARGSSHRRSTIALAMLGVALALSVAPGVVSANHGRPHPEVYLPELQEDFAIEYPMDVRSEPMPDNILAGFQERLAIEYPADTAAGAIPDTLFEDRQQQLAIEYPEEARSGRAQATHYGPPGR